MKRGNLGMFMISICILICGIVWAVLWMFAHLDLKMINVTYVDLSHNIRQLGLTFAIVCCLLGILGLMCCKNSIDRSVPKMTSIAFIAIIVLTQLNHLSVVEPELAFDYFVISTAMLSFATLFLYPILFSSPHKSNHKP